jgi:nucleoid-associated protein YgaU
VIADAKLQILEISTEADNAEVKLDMTNASGCNVTLNLAGQKDSVTILNAADKAEFAVYADKVDLKDKGTVSVSTAENMTLTATGADATVQIVQTSCDTTINTADGNDLIYIGVVYETEQENISGAHVTDGWVSAGAVHAITVNTGKGDDQVNVHSVQGSLKFSGGEGDDRLYIQEYCYADSYEKLPIGEFGAYQNVETVILNRVVDRYTVVKDDTLTSIAEMFDVTVEDLVKWNGEQILDPDLIFPGQVFIVGPYQNEEEIITDRIEE